MKSASIKLNLQELPAFRNGRRCGQIHRVAFHQPADEYSNN